MAVAAAAAAAATARLELAIQDVNPHVLALNGLYAANSRQPDSPAHPGGMPFSCRSRTGERRLPTFSAVVSRFFSFW